MKKILLVATETNSWAGGLYYIKNVAYQLIQNDYISKNYKILILTTKNNESVFKPLGDKVKIYSLKKPESHLKEKKLLFCIFHRIKYIFPAVQEDLLKVGIQPIFWIPDFQHCYFPGNFTSKEIEERNAVFKRSINEKIPLILSSDTCLNDYRKYYSKDKNNVYTMHFVSYISTELNHLTNQKEQEILDKYQLTKKNYICIANQFWQHKNHLVVFQALKKLVQNNHQDINLVFTGSPKDYRNPKYYKQLLEFINDDGLSRYIHILGFIDRIDQICILKNASYIIQPSLFEGWGTVVEDAKVLDKLILLSDIPVHREQMNEKCILFNPNDADDLASKMIEMNVKSKLYNEDIFHGVNDMKKRAIIYSKGFEILLRDCTKKGE